MKPDLHDRKFLARLARKHWFGTDEFSRVNNFASSVPTDLSGTRTKILSVLGPTREVVRARMKLVRVPKTLARVG